jgi:hypothetical protein
MQANRFIVLVLFVLIAPLYKNTENTEDDPDIIETRSFESYKIARPPEIQKACLTEELNAYSLWGDSQSLGDPNPICPNIQQNCCGPKDQRRINYIWTTDRKRQENHHRFVLKVYRYILGFGMKYFGVAKEVMKAWEIQKMRHGDKAGENQNAGQRAGKDEELANKNFVVTPSKFCYKHAKHVVESGFTDRKRAEAFYADLTLKVEFLENSRRGFYCSLCAGEAKEHFGTHWKLFDWMYKDRIFYDETFCQLIHEWTFRTIYTSWKSFRPYVSSIMKMLLCVNPINESGNQRNRQPNANKPARPNVGNVIGENIQLQFSAQFVQFDLKLSNPLENLSDYMKKIFNHPMVPHHPFKLEFCNGAVPGDFFFFTRCETFCQKWNIAKPVSLFDGSVKKIKQVYDFLLQYEFALSNNEQNLFRDKMNDLRKIIADSYEERNYKPFYTSIATDIKFDKYHSDFLGWWAGLHPMQLTEGSPLYFEYTYAGIVKVLTLALLAIFAF